MVRVRVSVRELREPAPHPLLQGPLVQHVHHHALTTGAGGKHEGCVPVGSPPELLPADDDAPPALPAPQVEDAEEVVDEE